MKIVLVSKNPKKAVEMQRMANELVNENVIIVSLSDIPEAQMEEQAEENGTTFMENAIIKAEYWAKKLQMPALAEDSGIMIDALDGAPGVETKRAIAKFFPGQDINVDRPSEYYPKLLEMMKASGDTSKRASWVSAMALAFTDGRPNIEAQNILYGEMCECAGIREFGFDQYFIPEEYHETLSEMEIAKKDAIGPRYKSLKEIFAKI